MEGSETLETLTSQPISVELGGKVFHFRRATLYDLSLINKLQAQKRRDGDVDSLEMDLLFYTLSLLVLVDEGQTPYTPEQLAKLILAEEVDKVKDVIEKAGLKAPQKESQ